MVNEEIKDTITEKSTESGSLIICPDCNKENPAQAKFCSKCGEKFIYNVLNSNSRLLSYDENKKGTFYSFNGSTADQVATYVNSFFETEGYKLESGTILNGKYGTGSHTLRLIAGVFIKRYKFNVNIYSDGNNTHLELSKAMSGISGGIFAVRALDKELKRISSNLKSDFEK
jgi:hypothetical protein